MENNIVSKITTKNYRNLINKNGVELSRLNILIGANGSGKSNFVAIFEFLKNCLTPSADLESRGVTAFQDALAKLGYNILDMGIAKPATIDFTFEFPGLHSSSGLLFELSLYIDKTVSIAKESLKYKKADLKNIGFPYYYSSHNKQIGKGSVSVIKNGKFGGTFILEVIPNNELSLVTIPNILTKNGDRSPEQIPLYKAQSDLEATVKKWQFYNANDMNLAKIRGASPKLGLNDLILAKSGENLPTVLDNIINHISYGIEFEERLNNAMKEILPATRKIRTSRDSGGMSLTIQWYFDGMERPFYLDDMSDGTVRMLCWATILYSPILPTLLVIDEPELSLHVAWMKILAEWIKQASQKTQIIISTHSPDLLDYFTDCAGDVICFESIQPKGYFQAKKLPEAILQDKINEGWQLGDLYRIGDNVIGGWPW